MQGPVLRNDPSVRRTPPKKYFFLKSRESPSDHFKPFPLFTTEDGQAQTCLRYHLLAQTQRYIHKIPVHTQPAGKKEHILERRDLVLTIENDVGVCHHTDSDTLYAVGGGNTGRTSRVTTNFIPYYFDKKYRREDTPVCMHTCTNVRMCVCMYVYVCMRITAQSGLVMYVCMYVCIFIK